MRKRTGWITGAGDAGGGPQRRRRFPRPNRTDGQARQARGPARVRRRARWCSRRWRPCPPLVEFSGPLVAPQTAMVRAKAGGTLLTLAVAEGSRVQAGQVLGTHRPGRAGQPRSPSATRMLESARAALAQAERTHASNQRLADAAVHLADRARATRAPRSTPRARRLDAAQAAAGHRARRPARRRAAWRRSAGIVAKRHVRAGREGQRRAAGADHRRPGAARAGRQRRHARGRAARAGHGGRRCRSKASREPVAGTHRAHRAGGRAGHALDRRHDRARQPEGDAARRPVRAGPRARWPTRRQRLTLPVDRGRQHRRARTTSG